jgi:hypothetical protein
MAGAGDLDEPAGARQPAHGNRHGVVVGAVNERDGEPAAGRPGPGRRSLSTPPIGAARQPARVSGVALATRPAVSTPEGSVP